eukprot:5337197-Amphidinium_carterae.2
MSCPVKHTVNGKHSKQANKQATANHNWTNMQDRQAKIHASKECSLVRQALHQRVLSSTRHKRRIKSHGKILFDSDLSTSSVPLPDRTNKASQRRRVNPTTQRNNANAASCAKVARIHRRNELSKQIRSLKPLKSQTVNTVHTDVARKQCFGVFGLAPS